MVEPERLLSIDSRVTPPEMLVHVFACRHVGGVPHAREAAVPEAGWFAPAEALRLVTRSPVAERLRDALASLAGLRSRTCRMQRYESLAEGSSQCRSTPVADSREEPAPLAPPRSGGAYTASSNSRSTSFRLRRRSCDSSRQPTMSAHESW